MTKTNKRKIKSAMSDSKKSSFIKKQESTGLFIMLEIEIN